MATCLALAAAAAWCAPARAACSPDRAKQTYADARRAFEEKRYDDSIVLLKTAYACDPNPVYLGNVARALEEAHRPKEALEAWRAFLVVTADPRERKQIEGRISALSKLVDDLERLEKEKAAAEEARRKAEASAHERESSAQAPAAAPAPAPRATHVSTGAWIVSGVGVAGLATGAVLGILASGKHGAATDEHDAVRAAALQDDARGLARAANVAFVAGGVVMAVGIAWIGVDLLRGSDGGARAALGVRGSSVMLEGRF